MKIKIGKAHLNLSNLFGGDTVLGKPIVILTIYSHQQVTLVIFLNCFCSILIISQILVTLNNYCIIALIALRIALIRFRGVNRIFRSISRYHPRVVKQQQRSISGRNHTGAGNIAGNTFHGRGQ